MKLKIINLSKRLDEINSKGFIKLQNDRYINPGLLLERELGIEANDFSVADIDGIEIKALKNFFNTPLTLFSCTCDGPDLFELNRLVERFGVRDYIFKNTRVLYTKLSAKEYTNWGKFLKMKLFIDRKNEKIYIIVANANNKIIEKRAFWNFSTLYEIIIRKIYYLCLVSFNTCIKHKQKYCHFYEYKFLKFTNFNAFLSELENGNIKVNIKYGVYKKGYKKGKSYNHGTAFTLERSSILKLFENVDVFEQKKSTYK